MNAQGQGGKDHCPECSTQIHIESGDQQLECVHLQCPTCKYQWCYICGLSNYSAVHFSGDGLCGITNSLYNYIEPYLNHQPIHFKVMGYLLCILGLYLLPLIGTILVLPFAMYTFLYYMPQYMLHGNSSSPVLAACLCLLLAIPGICLTVFTFGIITVLYYCIGLLISMSLLLKSIFNYIRLVNHILVAKFGKEQTDKLEKIC